jgi:hypothetical protein
MKTNGDLYQAHRTALLGRFTWGTMSFVMYVEYLHKYQASNVEFDATYEHVGERSYSSTPNSRPSMEWSHSLYGHFILGEVPCTHCIGSKVVFWASLGAVQNRKILAYCPFWESNADSSVVQPVAWSLCWRYNSYNHYCFAQYLTNLQRLCTPQWSNLD